MTDLFFTEERKLEDGLLTKINFNLGYCGVMEIFHYETLKIKRFPKLERGSRASLDMGKAKVVYSAFEHPDYVFKDKQPFDRGSQDTYIGCSFDSLDISPVSNSGRFFLSKQARDTSISTSADYYPDKEWTFVHPVSDLEAFSKDIGRGLELCGIPVRGTSDFRREIFKRFGFDVNRVADDYDHVDCVAMLKAFSEKCGQPMSSITELMLHLHDAGLSNEAIGDLIIGPHLKEKKEEDEE